MKTIFLVDGMGAVVSFLFTSLLLPIFSSELGLPLKTIYFLAVFPFLYACCSLGIYFFIKEIKKWMLTFIIGCNCFYCLVSVAVMSGSETITGWGIALLCAEILVIFLIVAAEIQVRRQYL
jgi:hypothetical protein